MRTNLPSWLNNLTMLVGPHYCVCKIVLLYQLIQLTVPVEISFHISAQPDYHVC